MGGGGEGCCRWEGLLSRGIAAIKKKNNYYRGSLRDMYM